MSLAYKLRTFDEYMKNNLFDMYYPVITVFKVIGIIVLSILMVKVGSLIIRKIFEQRKAFKYKLDSKKIDTMETLLTSILKYTVYIVSVIIILTDIFQLKSILAAAGIGGIALGFGAQSLIKDVISGFFIVFEDQYVVGDLITIETMNGTVEEMGLRVTKIRNFNGDLYIIPNGEIKKVTNHTRGNKAVTVDIPLAYSADLNKAIAVANSVCRTVLNEFETIVEDPKVLGVTELGKDSMNFRISAKTLPNEQWEVERRIRMLIREEFAKEKIEFSDKNRVIFEQGTNDGSNLNGR